MALLLRDREASPEAASPPPDSHVVQAAPEHACESCGAAMARGQDWCLECGAAAPGRLGARPGWRAAFTVVGVTLLLLCAAVVASYAALTSDAERSASAPAPASADPILAPAPAVAQAPAPVIQPGDTGPGVLPAPVVQPVVPTPQPVLPATNRPLLPLPQPGTPAPAGTVPTPGQAVNPGKLAALPLAPTLLELKPGAASTYDPAKRAGAEFGPAANAVDSKPSSVWDVVVPADGQPLGVGLMIDLGKPHALTSLRIVTPTPDFHVEIYGAVDNKQLPEDILDKRWIHLTDRKQVVDGKVIGLRGKGDGVKPALLLLHIIQAGEPTDPRVAIGDVILRGTP